MANDMDFDALAQKAIQSNGAIEDLNALYARAFALSQWHFIARGELPHVNPYIASNAEFASGQPMVRAFTGTERLMRFARENNLTNAAGEAAMLSIPTDNIVDYLEQFIAEGVHGIWFNSDSGSDGFFVPLQQLRPIQDHLQRLNLIARNTPKKAVETVIISVKDGLMLPSGFIAPASYSCHFFCRVPSDWVEGEHIKENYLEKIYQKVYGETWRSGNSDGSYYVVQDSYSKVFSPDTVKSTQWSGTVNDTENHFWFYIVSENGEVRNVTAEEFQADVDSAFESTSSETGDAPPKSEAFSQDATPVETADSYFSLFQQGTVKPDTSLIPILKAIAPLLADYMGSGEFTESFSPGTDERDMSDLVEELVSNAHGPCLKYKSYTFRRFGTEPPLEFRTLGSNRLKHVHTNQRLIVNFTLSKNPADSVTKLIVKILGLQSEVDRLRHSVQPALENCAFKVILESKGEPLPESRKLLED